MIDIKCCTAKLFKDKYGIEENVTQVMFDDGAIKEHVARDLLIKEEYGRKVGIKPKEMIRNEIAQRYCVSVELVKKIVLKDG